MQIDDLCLQRLLGRQARRLADRLLRPLDVAAAHLRQAADVGDGVVHRLFGHARMRVAARRRPCACRPAPACRPPARRRRGGRAADLRPASPRRDWSRAPSPRRGSRTGCRCRRWPRARRSARRSRPPAPARRGWRERSRASRCRGRPACPAAGSPTAAPVSCRLRQTADDVVAGRRPDRPLDVEQHRRLRRLLREGVRRPVPASKTSGRRQEQGHPASASAPEARVGRGHRLRGTGASFALSDRPRDRGEAARDSPGSAARRPARA